MQYSLSKREYQVAKAMKQGFQNKRIAEVIGISEKSVSTYKNRIRMKLHLSAKANDYIVVQKCIEQDLFNRV